MSAKKTGTETNEQVHDVAKNDLEDDPNAETATASNEPGTGLPIPAVAIPAAIVLELVDPPDATSEAHAAAAPIVETVDESILSEANASVSTYEVSGDNREIIAEDTAARASITVVPQLLSGHKRKKPSETPQSQEKEIFTCPYSGIKKQRNRNDHDSNDEDDDGIF